MPLGRAIGNHKRPRSRPLGGNATEELMANYIGAIDQGTTSTRFIVFDRSGRIVTTAQKEHEQIYPKPGWVEHNPEEIWARTQEVISEALKAKNLTAKDLAGVGI